jgi:hypothetical protein
MMPEILAFEAVLFICGTCAFVASLRFLRRFIELRHERSLAASTTELRERLDRIENAVESTALEVERISEANRFVAKLLAERSGVPNPQSRPERIITPH